MMHRQHGQERRGIDPRRTRENHIKDDVELGKEVAHSKTLTPSWVDILPPFDALVTQL